MRGLVIVPVMTGGGSPQSLSLTTVQKAKGETDAQRPQITKQYRVAIIQIRLLTWLSSE